MTRDEALRALGLRDDADRDAAQRAFDRQIAEVNQATQRVSTPEHRQKHEQRGRELRAAFEVLRGRATAPAELSETKIGDLPRATPSRTAGVDGAGGVAFARSSRDSGQVNGAPLRTDGPGGVEWRRGLVRQALGLLRESQAVTPQQRTSADSVQLKPGQILADRFEILAELGSGGMGAVYAARDAARGEEVALKVLLPHLRQDPKAHQRFLDEARTSSKLSHANIVRVHDVHQTASVTFLSMELLQGKNLRQRIEERKNSSERFSIAEVRAIAAPLCAALDYAHKETTVHRDVKPENIWVGDDEAVKLMDFGIARVMRPSHFTSTGRTLGTAYYMAPEQMRGAETVDHRADQYAVGVVLYELLTGKLPTGKFRAPRELRRSVPAAMSRAVMKALESEPADRYANMKEFHEALSASGGTRTRRLAIAGAAAAMVAVVLVLASGAAPEWRSRLLAILGILGQPPPRPIVVITPEIDGDEHPKFVEKEPNPPDPPMPKKVEQRELLLVARGKLGEAEQHAKLASESVAKEKQAEPEGIAGQVADLWVAKHQSGRRWFEKADHFKKQAEDLEKNQRYEQAAAELEKATDEYRRAPRWLENARQALRKIEAFSDELMDRIATAGVQSRALDSWVQGMVGRIEEILEGDDEGQPALNEADRLCGLSDEISRSLDRRVSALKQSQELLSAGTAPPESLKDQLARAQSRVSKGDEDLTRERFTDARKAYDDASSLFVWLANHVYNPSNAITNTLGMRLSLIPAGEFWMGSPEGEGDDDEHPRHQVEISKPFYLGTTEVTRGQYRQFVEATGKHDEGWLKPGFEQTDEHPVVEISWDDAVAFCEWLSEKEHAHYRLPTEAEWEYACRAGTTTKYWNGDDPERLVEVGNVADAMYKGKYPKVEAVKASDGFADSAPVHHFKPNSWGLFDIHGNVWEWCSDLYDSGYYKVSPLVDPPGPGEQGSLRVGRGGDSGSSPRNIRSAKRGRFAPGHRHDYLGFRLARDLYDR